MTHQEKAAKQSHSEDEWERLPLTPSDSPNAKIFGSRFRVIPFAVVYATS